MNRVELVGRLTNEPVVKYSTGEQPIASVRFTVAINRPKKPDGKQEADFVSCIAFSGRAEVIGKYFHKGSLIGVSGNWHTGSYNNAEGTKIYTNDCLVDNIDFIDSKPNTTEAGGQSNNDSAVDDDDLPF